MTTEEYLRQYERACLQEAQATARRKTLEMRVKLGLTGVAAAKTVANTPIHSPNDDDDNNDIAEFLKSRFCTVDQATEFLELNTPATRRHFRRKLLFNVIRAEQAAPGCKILVHTQSVVDYLNGRTDPQPENQDLDGRG